MAGNYSNQSYRMIIQNAVALPNSIIDEAGGPVYGVVEEEFALIRSCGQHAHRAKNQL